MFPITLGQLFADSVRQYPIKEPTIEDVSFQLRTPCGRREYAVSEASKLRDDPDFDINKKTVVFNTGWLVTPDTDHVGDMEKAYHCRGGHNFIVSTS